jgi:regulator of protease activity HflC (stomatin/prohibitin superfamily)
VNQFVDNHIDKFNKRNRVLNEISPIIGGAAILIVGLGLIYLIIYFLSEIPVYWAAPSEGTAMGITSGNSKPRFIAPMENAYLNNPDKPGYIPDVRMWEVVQDPQNKYASKHRAFLGLYWAGFFPFQKVYWYQFRWTEWTQPQQNEANIPVGRDEQTNFIFTKEFTYYSRVNDIKTNNPKSTGQELISVDIEYVITVRCTNPYVALFVNDDWLAKLFSISNNAVRNYGGRRSYADLASEKDMEKAATDNSVEAMLRREQAGQSMTEEEDTLNADLIKLNYQIPGNPREVGVIESLGMTICSGEIVSVGFGKDVSKELREATVRKYIAEQDAKRTIITSEAAKAARKNATDAEVYDIDQRNAAMRRNSDTALPLKWMETLSEAGKSGSAIIVTSNPDQIDTNTLVRVSSERKAHEGAPASPKAAPAKQPQQTT